MARRHGGPVRNVRPGRDADLYGGGRRNAYDRQWDRSLFEDGDAREYLDYVSYAGEPMDERRRQNPRKGTRLNRER